VILLDVNLLIYAVNSDSLLHRQARSLLEQLLSGKESVGFSLVVLLAFLRITTKPGLFPKPLSPAQAFQVVEDWLGLPASVLVHPGPSHLGHLRRLLLPLGTGGNLTSDAHLATLALELNAELYSCDQDFSRFPGLRWRNPLA
jgi:toxin-antitoxin system PIN domain toxin